MATMAAIISVGTKDSIAFCSTMTFTQNIVIGGSPPMFLMVTKEVHGDLFIFSLFLFSFIKNLMVRKREAEYISSIIQKVDTADIHASSIHPLLFREDNAIILLNVSPFCSFLRGLKDLARASRRRVLNATLDKLIDITKKIGKIFCHVIIVKNDGVPMFIVEISFKYHMCDGQAPIFMSKAITSTISVIRVCSGTIEIKIATDDITWIR